MSRVILVFICGMTCRAAGPISALKIEPSRIEFNYAGEQRGPFKLEAVFADGSKGPIGDSRALQYSTENRAVASVDSSGVLTAAGAGTTRLTVRVQNVTTTVLISVRRAKPGDFNADSIVDMEDLKIVQGALHTRANGPGDARDLNHDGKIDALDLRILATMCSFERCGARQ